MAKFKGMPGMKLSGNIGGLVFVQVGDQTYVRRAPTRKKDSWSQKQQQHRARFKSFTGFYRSLRETVVKPIWNLSATKNLTGYNLFMKANLPAFSSDGGHIDPALLHFSTGPLPLPRYLSAWRDVESPATIEISWHTEIITRMEQPDDELLIAVRSNFQSFGPIETGCLRKDGNCLFDVSEWESTSPLNLYLFFASADRTRYSPDHHFGL